MTTLTVAFDDPVPHPRDDVRVVGVEDGVLLCASEQLMRLNLAGAAAWSLVDGQRTVRGIAAGIADANGSTADSLLEPTRRFVRDLILGGFLEPPAVDPITGHLPLPERSVVGDRAGRAVGGVTWADETDGAVS